jgi:very-short-patch-repair endonuclease
MSTAELFDTPKKLKRSRNERFERELAFQIRAHKMPQPAEQYRWATELENENGRPRQFRADFAWPQFRLLIEVQGGVWRPGGGAHSHPSNIERDIDKQQCAVLLSWFVLPVTTDEVKNGKAIAMIERVLASRGWTR